MIFSYGQAKKKFEDEKRKLYVLVAVIHLFMTVRGDFAK